MWGGILPGSSHLIGRKKIDENQQEESKVLKNEKCSLHSIKNIHLSLFIEARSFS